LDLKVFKAFKAQKARLDRKDRKAHRDFREYPVLTVPQVIWASLVSLVTREVPGLLELLVPPETLAHRVLKENKARPDRLEQTARTGSRERMEKTHSRSRSSSRSPE